MIKRSFGAGLLLVVLTGCGVQRFDWDYICDNPEPDHLGPDGAPDPCHERDVGGDLGCKVGDFVHWRHSWDSPSWVWIGAEGLAPTCPLGPKTISYEGRTDLIAPNICEACTCEQPTGSCVLPSTLMASMGTCDNFKDGPFASFNAPTPWNGKPRPS